MNKIPMIKYESWMRVILQLFAKYFQEIPDIVFFSETAVEYPVQIVCAI